MNRAPYITNAGVLAEMPDTLARSRCGSVATDVVYLVIPSPSVGRCGKTIASTEELDTMGKISKEAKAAYDKEYHTKNAAKKRGAASVWYYANKERALKRQRAKYVEKIMREENRVPSTTKGKPKIFTADETKARKALALKKWRDANPEKHKAQSKRHYENTKPRIIATMRNRRAKIAGLDGTHTAADIAELRAKQKDNCAFCLKPLGNATPDVDHYIPIALGGSNGKRNLRLLHARCNRSKHAKHPLDFGLKHGLLAW